MKWSEEFATGVAKIDEQHKMLFKMVSDFRETLNEGRGDRVYGSLLESLQIYARSHFGSEEACMFRYKCPAAQRNKDAHTDFMQLLAAERSRFRSSGYSRVDATRLVEMLEEWLVDHICTIDVQLRDSVPPQRMAS